MHEVKELKILHFPSVEKHFTYICHCFLLRQVGAHRQMVLEIVACNRHVYNAFIHKTLTLSLFDYYNQTYALSLHFLALLLLK